MRPVTVTNGPTLSFPILDQLDQPCLQVAAFSEPATAWSSVHGTRTGTKDSTTRTTASWGSHDAPLVTLCVLNICNQTIDTTVPVPGATGATATVYSLLDPGVADPGPLPQRGWAPLPDEPDKLPWTSGPLHPTTETFTASPTGHVPVTVPGLALMVVDIT